MTRQINILKDFAAFVPNSRGDQNLRLNLTIDNIKKIFPSLVKLSTDLKHNKTTLIKAESIPNDDEDKLKCQELKKLLDTHGSDKSNRHNYHYVYAPILKKNFEEKKILEIGMGTNNIDTLSNMGIDGKPGASLKAFRDFCPYANIYGADVDKRILFDEERINTYYVDQTDVESLNELSKKIPSDLDLVIDDGLHSPCANINTLFFGIKKIKIGGWVVIEDIQLSSKDIWLIISNLIPSNFKTYLIVCNRSLLFALKKVS